MSKRNEAVPYAVKDDVEDEDVFWFAIQNAQKVKKEVEDLIFWAEKYKKHSNEAADFAEEGHADECKHATMVLLQELRRVMNSVESLCASIGPFFEEASKYYETTDETLGGDGKKGA